MGSEKLENTNYTKPVGMPHIMEAEVAGPASADITRKEVDDFEHLKKIFSRQKENAGQIQKIQESLDVYEMKPVVDEQGTIESLQEIILNDLRTGSEHGPYTEMRKRFLEIYEFDYAFFESQVQQALSHGQSPAQVEIFSKTKIQNLIDQIWKDRKTDLEQWADLLGEGIKQNHDSIQSIQKNLEQFYGTNFQNKSFQIHLAPNPVEHSFLAVPSEQQLGRLTIFVPRLSKEIAVKKQEIANDLLVDSFHEMSHQQLQTEFFAQLEKLITSTPEYREVLQIFCGGQEPYYNFTKEAVTNYIDAYLRQTNFNKEALKKTKHQRDVYAMGSWINTGLAAEYFQQGKRIDPEFIIKLFQLMKG